MHELVHPVRAHLALLQAEGSVVVQGLLHFVAKKLTKNDTRFDVHFNKIRLGVSIVFGAGHSCDSVVHLPRTGHC